jgi:hypothetical protein
MKIIQSQYGGPSKSDDQTRFTLAVMERLFAEWDYSWIEKALFEFMQTDSKFPPNAGQLITLAKEMRRAEWDRKQREQDLLPEPEAECIPMPDDIREELERMGLTRVIGNDL